MEQVRIHTGTHVKLKHVDETTLPQGFLSQLREFIHKQVAIEAVYLFAMQPEDQELQVCIALGMKKSMFGKKDEEFFRIVDEIQLLLPEELAINLYRFGSSEFLARYCLKSLDPIYLRSSAWLDKQIKRYAKP